MKKLTLLVYILFALCATSAFGKTLYVDINSPECSDATTYANNDSNNPWCSVGRAAWGSTSVSAQNSSQAAQVGDVVRVMAGTYPTNQVHGESGKFPVYSPANGGADGNLITFQAVGTVVLTRSGGTSGALIGAYGVDYIKWDGFTIDEANAPSVSDTGTTVLWYTTGSQIVNCVIDGNGSAGGRQDNHTGIRLEYAEDILIKNNAIYAVTMGTDTSGHHNGAGIMAYYSSDVLIENNHIYDCGASIFVKGGDNANFTIRYNLLKAFGNGIDLQYTSATGVHNVYQNVIYNSSSGVKFGLLAHNIEFYNNTIYNCANGFYLGASTQNNTDHNVKDNIVHSLSEWFSGGEASSVAFLNIDYNMYVGSANGWSISGVLYGSLANWRNALGGTQTGDEYHSVQADPLFVNAASNDFRLSPSSPALTSSSTGGVVGAYITGNEVIGLDLANYLYVDQNDPDCSDSRLYSANTAELPWCTIGRAAWGSTNRLSPNFNQAAQAGDTVIVAAGTYSAPGSGSRLTPAFNPANSGTSGNPITFLADGVVNLTLTAGTAGPVFGAHERNYITWDGFTINEASYTPYAGERSIGVCWLAHHTTFRNNRLIGTTLGEGNHAALRSEDSFNCTMEYNTISDVYSSGDQGNTEGILAYNSVDLTIRYNHIYNCSQGIFIKGNNPGPVYIYNNLLHGFNANGLYILGLGEDGNGGGGLVYRNIVYNSYAGLTLNSIGGGPDKLVVVNNVFDGTTWGGYFSTALTNNENIIRNNIFSNSSQFGWAIAYPYTNNGSFVINNNLYYSVGTFARINYANYTFDQWRSNWSHDINGAVANPLFTNITNRDYTLQVGSPGRSMGYDVLNLSGNGIGSVIDVGAYVPSDTCIGVCAETPPVPLCETNPDYCINESECVEAGWNWCTDVCQSEECPGPPVSTFMIFNNTGRPAVFDSGAPAVFGN